ncbi:hypothetical protein FEM03_19335 [Phragmitibacter flavus]|uniref:Uncharacterized protein n=1 Tax=Phragmitibacter flavus TaxID=2576071 RepID=A0A5R8K9P0_9BACT|nr:hypothetical protein [Phragmitibacter flavus]TLD69024.1 hypothetical protein FEM03_19335 [Phragmitibacter flavus]
MKLFLAIRWGHDAEGPDGSDTHFIVRADDRDQAVALVDFHLQNNLTHQCVEPLCHRITEFGVDTSSPSRTEASILWGPSFEATHFDLRGYTTWMREAQTEYRWEDEQKWFGKKTADR